MYFLLLGNLLIYLLPVFLEMLRYLILDTNTYFLLFTLKHKSSSYGRNLSYFIFLIAVCCEAPR